MKNNKNKYFGLFSKMIFNPQMYIFLKSSGLNFVFYDLEHGFLTTEKLHDLILFGNNVGVPTFVRVAELSRKEVSQALDCGARAVMVPMIENKEQARKLVEYSKYPPLGSRSYSSGANTNYGPSGNHAVNIKKNNESVVTIAQIETKLGVENAEDIVSTEGIDAVIVGPVDLSISLGNTGNIMHENTLNSISNIADICKQYEKPFGIIGSNELLNYFKKDLNYFISATDNNILREGIDTYSQIYKKMVENYDEN